MKTPFHLDEHPRRPQPLAGPPAGYFDRLPMQIMARVQPSAPRESTAPGWLTALSMPLRTALASVVVLGGFTVSFLLSPTATAPAKAVALAQVPETEMVQYLLASDTRVSLTDLADLAATDRALTNTYLQASPNELQDALDAQPTDEIYL
ncbi:hypothetical protein SAMN02745146_2777 [Hymenobacter daecheongensis DSM 21074]|uniref:Uncharacterized protein n=1 Tax=Hymenobacter daecheongensis DSM 21074 TaxID=1121955 RepID=A0A1M6I3H0_9BACT|nr:hypothetical protein [Hymenobacter daecheongensis]SHJ29041.1 hypothetical protein SAMN02745146_2777 [Hymenobacter daecheongensis DSM 21074]